MNKNIFIAVALIIILGFTVYSNSLNGKFIWDDEHLIKDNAYLKDWSNIAKIFTEDMAGGAGKGSPSYRPLRTFTYLIDYSFWGLNVRGYHLTNISLHILVALVIYWLISILYEDRLLSLYTSIFFVIHPIHTESVSYITGRSNPLALLFILLCFIFYIKSLDLKSLTVYIIMILSYILALLSRENSIILPALLLLYHYTFKKRLKIKQFLSILSIASIYILIRMTVLKFMLLYPRPDSTTLIQRVPGFFAALTTYIKLLFLPFDLHMEYGNRLFNFSNFQVILGIAILFSLLIFAFRKRNTNKLIFFSISWFFVALLSVSNIYPIHPYVAERYLYLPSLGFFLILAHFLSYTYRAKHFKNFAIVITIALIPFYSYLTIRQNDCWREPIAFYKRTLKYAPNSPRVYYNLAVAYSDLGKPEEKITLYKKVIELCPSYAEAYNNLALIYADTDRQEEAIALFKKAIELKPDYAKAYYNLALTYKDIDKKEEAITLFKKSIELNPDIAEAYNNLANLYSNLGKQEEAIALFKKAIELNPDDAKAYYNLALSYFYQKQYKLAIEYCDKARELGFNNYALLEQHLKPYRQREEIK